MVSAVPQTATTAAIGLNICIPANPEIAKTGPAYVLTRCQSENSDIFFTIIP